MAELKIPLGLHKPSGRLVDAPSVPRGLKCECDCHVCGTRLEAVHPNLLNRVKYFRHHNKNNCDGALESLFHKAAKQILQESHNLRVNYHEDFAYTHCDIETVRHGKRPDAYIVNDGGGLVVEILFTHAIKTSTLDTYLQHGERVLEIDISSERRSIFDYECLKRLLLTDAPRFLYEAKAVVTPSSSSEGSGTGWLVLLLLLLLGLLGWAGTSRRRSR